MNNEWFYIKQWENQRKEREIMSGLLWYQEEISFVYNDMLIEAIVNYCAKDYKIKIVKPIAMELPGRHLPYAMPARYVMNEDNDVDNNRNINILESCKAQIIEALKEKE